MLQIHQRAANMYISTRLCFWQPLLDTFFFLLQKGLCIRISFASVRLFVVCYVCLPYVFVCLLCEYGKDGFYFTDGVTDLVHKKVVPGGRFPLQLLVVDPGVEHLQGLSGLVIGDLLIIVKKRHISKYSTSKKQACSSR